MNTELNMSEERKENMTRNADMLYEFFNEEEKEYIDNIFAQIHMAGPYDEDYYYEKLEQKVNDIKLKYVVVSGLNDQDTNFSNFLHGHRLYDPRLLLTVAQFMK